MDDPIEQMLIEIRAALDHTDMFRSKTFIVFEVEDFETKSDSIALPTAGIAYVGAQPVDNQKNRGKVGDATFAVFYAVDVSNLGPNPDAVGRETRKPLFEGWKALNERVSDHSGRPYLWAGESIFTDLQGVVVYQQQWSNRVVFNR